MGMGEAIVLVHFLFVVFVVGGGLLALRWPRLAWLHLPAALWGASVVIWGLPCPLTELEFALVEGQPERGFIARLLLPVLYPELENPQALSGGLGLALGAGVVLVNAAVYGLVLKRRRRPPTPPRPAAVATRAR